MASIEEIRAERLKKLELLKERGINPYPIVSKRSMSVADALLSFKKFIRANKNLTLAGRVTAIRGQGALAFINIQDGDGMIQGFLKKGEVKGDLLELFQETVDHDVNKICRG